MIFIDPEGLISYWNRGAEELFGHRWEAVFGRPASGLLPCPRPPAAITTDALGRLSPTEPIDATDALDTIDDLTRPRWTGSFSATDRDGTLRETLWWSYRLTAPAERGLLVLAAGARGARSGALRLALGDRLIPYAPAGPVGPDGLRITPRFGPAAPDDAAAAQLGLRLGAVLPRVSPVRLERIMRQVAALGHPAVEIDGCGPLAVLPYEAAGTRGTTAGRRNARRHHELPPAPADAAPERPPLTPVPHFPPAVPGNVIDQQLALLRETGVRVGTTLELDTTARELCSVAVPRFADFATVLIVDHLFSDTDAPERAADRPADADGAPPGRSARSVTVRRIAVAGRRGGEWEATLPEGELFTLPAEGAPGIEEPLLLPVIDPMLAEDLAADLGIPAAGRLLAGHSLLITPLTARGTVLGRMCLVRTPQRRPFDASDTATAAELAARGAVHLDNARLHRLESRAAATLQRSMLPTRPPRIPGVRIAHHYRPGDRQAQVGGDWFDAIQLPGGRVALVVGDVMGHGLLSAAVMGQFRTAVQTMAALDLPPAQLLRHLDNLAQRLGTDHLATCVYAVYDPIHRTLTLANAGHIPPVLARHDGLSELLRIPKGAPIGVGGVPFETVEIPVPDGSWLVLCTDGLVEVRGQGIDAGLAALCANVIEPQHTPEDVCNQILGRVHSEDRGDDVALLVARFEGIAPQDVAEWQLRLDHAEVRTARSLTRKQLAEWGLGGQVCDLAELLVSELVTNALRVASHEVQLRLMRVGKLLVEVSDDDHNLPQLRRADADDEDGRGLTLVSNLSHRWGTSRKAVGKVVWFELPLPDR